MASTEGEIVEKLTAWTPERSDCWAVFDESAAVGPEIWDAIERLEPSRVVRLPLAPCGFGAFIAKCERIAAEPAPEPKQETWRDRPPML